MTRNLGAIKNIDVRKVWAHEAQDFTPWLAEEENIRLLGDALGIELEVENTEVAVGPYSADILARETGTGSYVVIENQLEKTNHDHLGKIITYAAVLDASAVIWIAKEFTDEHHRALDWLNDLTSEDISFYGVKLQLWQIDDSNPAIQYEIVSRPTEIRKAAAAGGSQPRPQTAIKKLQLEFWTSFADSLVKTKKLPSVHKPGARYWFNVSLGRTGILLSNIADTYGNKIGIRVYLRGRHGADMALDQLLTQKNEIEREIGQELIWCPNPENKDKTIVLYKDADIREKENWNDYIEWMVEMTVRFREVFMPRVKKLDLPMQQNNAEDLDD